MASWLNCWLATWYLIMSKNILLEDRRSALLSQSKKGADYAPQNQYYGANRYKRRLRSSIAPSIKHFNNMDMDKFFKTDTLDVSVDIRGETNIYKVRMSFVGALDELHKEIAKNNIEQVDRKIILKALMNAFNRDDVYINCSCPDFRYRFKYWATRKGLLIGEPENRPADITNPSDNKGPGCKHIILCLSDSSWLIKIASVIFNYINYMESHDERLYQKYIYPAVYDKEYDNRQLSIFDDEEEVLDSDEETIKTSNIEARKKGQFKKGNEYRFRKDNNDQITFDDLENEFEEEESDEI